MALEATAVSIAMYCIIQFYIQLRFDLAEYRPFLKVLAIKLVIFLSFWQSSIMSVLTSPTLNVIKATSKVAYPDISVGIPSMLLCMEMALFSILHLFAFPWRPYRNSKVGGDASDIGAKKGGFLGFNAFADAMNPWDLVKAFARGIRWLFVGRKHREEDISYKPYNGANDVTLEPTGQGYKADDSLPIAHEFRRSNFGIPGREPGADAEEGAGLIAYAQPNPLNQGGSSYPPAHLRYDNNGQDTAPNQYRYDGEYDNGQRYPSPRPPVQDAGIGMALSDPEPYPSHVVQPANIQSSSDAYLQQLREQRRQQAQKPSDMWAQTKRPATPEGYDDRAGRADYDASYEDQPRRSPQPPHNGQY